MGFFDRFNVLSSNILLTLSSVQMPRLCPASHPPSGLTLIGALFSLSLGTQQDCVLPVVGERKKGKLSCCKCFLTSLKLIWPTSNLKISRMSKKCVSWQKGPGGKGLNSRISVKQAMAKQRVLTGIAYLRLLELKARHRSDEMLESKQLITNRLPVS